MALHPATGFAREDARTQFRNAAYLEEAVGDLDGALEAYRGVIAARDASPELLASARLRAGACLELLSRPGEAVPIYAAALRDTPVELAPLRSEARRRLAALEERAASPVTPATPPRPTDALIDRFESDDPVERYKAIADLRAEKPADVVAAIVRRLAPPPATAGESRGRSLASPKLRHYAVILLGHLGDPAALPALRACLADPIAEVRCNAALSLFRLGDRSGLGTLKAELEGGPRAVRSLAAAHLAWFGDRAGTAVLVEDLASPDAYARASAIQALARLYGDDLGFAADAPEETRAAALARWRERVKK